MKNLKVAIEIFGKMVLRRIYTRKGVEDLWKRRTEMMKQYGEPFIYYLIENERTTRQILMEGKSRGSKKAN